VLQSETQNAIFNTSGGLNGGTGDRSQSAASPGAGANSNPGFVAIGSFGGQSPSTAPTVGGQSPGSPSFGGLTGGVSGTTTGNGFVLPAVQGPPPPPVNDVSDFFALLRSTVTPLIDALPPLDDSLDIFLAIGLRPAGLADLGRAGPGIGATTDVFRKGYPLARILDQSVCGSTRDLQPAGTDKGDTRKCQP
jgi:hypothetical protein